MHTESERLRAVTDTLRVRMLRVLILAGEPLCVCELVDILRRPQYAVSRALSALRSSGLVEEERRGRLKFYRLHNDPFNRKLFDCLAAIPTGDEAADDEVADSEAAYDRDRLRWRLELRQEGRCVVTYTQGYNPGTYRTEEEHAMNRKKPRVLVICTHNSARSQMAQTYLRDFAGDLFEVESAGLEPGRLNPNVVEVMAEEGYDISGNTPQRVFGLYASGRVYTYVITVCDRKTEEKCPIFPGPVTRLRWPFPDPSRFTGTQEEILRQTREVRDMIRNRVAEFVQQYRQSASTQTEDNHHA
jgi:arsenate reductase